VFGVFAHDPRQDTQKNFRDERNHQTSDDIVMWLEAPDENPDNPNRKSNQD
jgi:hypothetical protein